MALHHSDTRSAGISAAFTVLKTKSFPSGRPAHYLRGRNRLNGPCRTGSSTWHRHFMEAAVIGSGADERIGHTGDLCSDSDVGLTLTVCTAWITPRVALELSPETVFA